MSLFTDENHECTLCEVSENMDLLRRSSIFSVLSTEALKVMAYLCNRETYQEQEIIFTRGDDDGQAFYIIAGKAAIFRENDEETVLREYEAEEIIGILSLFSQAPRLFTLKAVEKTDCLVISRDRFARLTEQFADIPGKVLKAVSRRIMAAEDRALSSGEKMCEICKDFMGISLI